eukprot:6125000-Amphidinium_carterae.1
MRMGFGRYQGVLMPKSKYWMKVSPTAEDQPEWKLVEWSAFHSHYPQKMQRYGVVEFLVQGMTCTYALESGELQGFQPFCKPRIIEKGNSSCIHSAVLEEVPQLGSRFAELCAKVPFALVLECPDAHSANKRHKAKTHAELPSNAFAVDACCGTHQAHRIIAATEKTLISDLRALYATCAHLPYQNLLQDEASILQVLLKPESSDIALNHQNDLNH